MTNEASTVLAEYAVLFGDLLDAQVLIELNQLG